MANEWGDAEATAVASPTDWGDKPVPPKITNFLQTVAADDRLQPDQKALLTSGVWTVFDQAAAQDPSLTDRFDEHFVKGWMDESLLGGVTKIVQAKSASTNDEVMRNYVRTAVRLGQYEGMPDANGVAENAMSVLGQIGGGAGSPENFIPIGRGGSLAVRMAKAAGTAVAAGAIAEPLIQYGSMAEGTQKDFSLPQALYGAVLNAAGGAGVEAAHSIFSAARARLTGPETITPEVVDEVRQAVKKATGVEADPVDVETVLGKGLGEPQKLLQNAPPTAAERQAAAADAKNAASPKWEEMRQMFKEANAVPEAPAEAPAAPMEPPNKETTPWYEQVDQEAGAADAANQGKPELVLSPEEVAGSVPVPEGKTRRDMERASGRVRSIDTDLSRLDAEEIALGPRARNGGPALDAINEQKTALLRERLQQQAEMGHSVAKDALTQYEGTLNQSGTPDADEVIRKYVLANPLPTPTSYRRAGGTFGGELQSLAENVPADVRAKIFKANSKSNPDPDSYGAGLAGKLQQAGLLPEDADISGHFGDVNQMTDAIAKAFNAPPKPANLPPKLDLPLIDKLTQAKRNYREYGFINARLGSMIGLGGAGGIYGFATGDTPEDRMKRMLEFGAAGAAAGFFGPAAIGRLLSKENRLRLNEKVQDSFYRVRKLQEETGIIVTPDGNPTEAFRLMPGRAATAIEKKNIFAEKFVGDMIKSAKAAKVEPKELANEVNAYLQALHAPERNAIHGDGAAGMSDLDAGHVISALQSLPYFPEIQRLAGTLKAFHDLTLEILHDGQLITDETYNALQQAYPNHVPLQREFGDDVGGALGGRGLDVKSSGIIRAKGSDLPVADILGNVMTNYEMAVMRSEKNRVDLNTLKFARNNWALGLFEQVQQKPIGTTPSGSPLYAPVNDPQILQMREAGKPVFLKINDPDLAVALRGVNRTQLDGVLRWVGAYSRLQSSLATRFNLEFGIPNKIRDLQEAAVYMAAKDDMGFAAAGKGIARDPASMKDVVDGLRGANTPGARLYQQMKEDGGTTGGMSFSSRQKTSEDLAAIWKRLQSTPRTAVHGILGMIDHWNTVWEDSTRLSIYRQALASGASRERAAYLAKEGTIDFNRMGTAGPLMNALYMFSNASMQGSAKMIRAFKNPKVAAATIAAVATAVYLASQWNDRVDPDWRDKVSKWDRLNGLPVMIPGHLPWQKPTDANYLTIPVSWGLKPIKVASDKAFDLMNGHGDPKQAIGDIAGAAIEGYNPAGGSDLMQAVTPTILDIPVDIARNKKWSGSKIKPDTDENMPESLRYFPSLKNSAQGRVLIAATAKASEESNRAVEVSPADINYALESIVGGAGRILTKTGRVLSGALQGTPPDINDLPFASRFLRSVPAEQQGAGQRGNPSLDQALEDQSRIRQTGRNEAQDFVDSLTNMTPDQKVAAIGKLDDQQFATVKALLDKRAEGMSGTEARMMQLGVENGARATFIADELGKMKTPEEKQQYLERLIEVGIMSQAVQEQLSIILANPPQKAGKRRAQIRSIQRDNSGQIAAATVDMGVDQNGKKLKVRMKNLERGPDGRFTGATVDFEPA